MKIVALPQIAREKFGLVQEAWRPRERPTEAPRMSLDHPSLTIVTIVPLFVAAHQVPCERNCFAPLISQTRVRLRPDTHFMMRLWFGLRATAPA